MSTDIYTRRPRRPDLPLIGHRRYAEEVTSEQAAFAYNDSLPRRSEEERRRLPMLSDEEYYEIQERARQALAEWEAENGPITEEEREATHAKFKAALGDQWPD